MKYQSLLSNACVLMLACSALSAETQLSADSDQCFHQVILAYKGQQKSLMDLRQSAIAKIKVEETKFDPLNYHTTVRIFDSSKARIVFLFTYIEHPSGGPHYKIIFTRDFKLNRFERFPDFESLSDRSKDYN
jgi:hypothetical protein